MSDRRQTFIDPKTGEEIESTKFARLGLWLVLSILVIACDVLIYASAKFGLVVLLIPIALFIVFMVWKANDRDAMESYEKFVHDHIACWQHYRRKKLLRRKLAEEEWAGVPDNALTLVDRSTSPQATDVALSLADAPDEEKERLANAVEENPERRSLWQRLGSGLL